MGCAFPEGEQGLNVARLVSFLAGLPVSTAGQTVNRFCGSSMQSVHIAAANIAAGAGEVFIAAGVESMTRIPMTGFNPLPHPGLYKGYPQAYESMGVTAENVAKKYGINRRSQEEFALESHKKAASAVEKGFFNNEIVSIVRGSKVVAKDGCIRSDTTLEKLATLQPAFDKEGTVTAATSSPLTDGAVALLICSESYAKNNNMEIMARIKSFAVSGCQPEIMGIGPVNASKKALQRAGLGMQDMNVVELNEAFAAQALAVIKELNINTQVLNIDGGAIALGHPLGASGARIVVTLVHALQQRKGKIGVAGICNGGGGASSIVIERI
jgi:acetyl-CoA acyltransferase